MKKLMKVAVVAIFAAASVTVGGSVSAQQATCEVGYTGPGTNNTCTITRSYECTVTNNNNVTIVNTNDQNGISGTAIVSGNTTGGGATSGTISNSNGTEFNISITNATQEGSENETRTCTITRTVPATNPPAPVVPTNGGGGAAEVKALPATSADTSLATFAAIAGTTVAVAAGSVAGAAAYRRLKA